jgi:hypothetical protein
MVVRPCARGGDEAITTTMTTKEWCRAELLNKPLGPISNGDTDKRMLGSKKDNGEEVIGLVDGVAATARFGKRR